MTAAMSNREAANELYAEIRDAIENDCEVLAITKIEEALAAVRAERDEEIYELREECLDADIELHNSGLKQGASMERDKWAKAAREAIREWENVIAGVKANDPDVVIIDGAYHEALAALVEGVGK